MNWHSMLKQNAVLITVNTVVLIIQVSWLNHKAINGLLSGPIIMWDKSPPLLKSTQLCCVILEDKFPIIYTNYALSYPLRVYIYAAVIAVSV